MTTIIDYLEGRGIKTKKKTAKEKSSACPFCGGDDRFIIYEEKRAWCRQCDWKGDYIQLLIDKEGYDFVSAAKATGQEFKLSAKGKKRITEIKKLEHPSHGKPDITYKYFTNKGDVHLVIARWNANNQGRLKKLIAQYNPYANTWTGANALTPILYNLQMLSMYEDVYFVEGEKCVEALRNIGLTGTTIAGGSSKHTSFDTWQASFQVFDPLAGKNVYILPDRDPVGDKFAAAVASIVSPIAKTVKIVNLPDLPVNGGDVADYIKDFKKDGNIRTAIESEARNAISYKPYTTAGDLYEANFSHKPDVIFGGLLPSDGHMLVAGEAGVGKSLFRMELAIHLAVGEEWLGYKIPQKHRIAVFQYENTERQEQYRLTKMLYGLGLTINQVRDRIVWMNRDRLNLANQGDQAKLLSMVKQSGCDVIIYDSLSNMHQSKENDNIKLRAVLDTFSDINDQLKTSCILIHHFGKPGEHNTGQKKYRIRGASSILDWAMTAAVFTEVKTVSSERRTLREVEFVKVRDGRVPPVRTFERDDDNFLLDETEDTLRINAATITSLLYEFIDDNGREPSIADISKIMREVLHNGITLRQCENIVKRHAELRTLQIGDPSGQGGARRVTPLLPKPEKIEGKESLRSFRKEKPLREDDPDYVKVDEDKSPKQQQEKLF